MPEETPTNTDTGERPEENLAEESGDSSRINNLRKRLINSVRKAGSYQKEIIGIGILGSIAYLYFGSESGNENFVYRGNIEGYPVVYTEGKNNVMEVKDGRFTYRFTDSHNLTNIDWEEEKAPKYQSDKLEEVVVTSKTARHVIAFEGSEPAVPRAICTAILDDSNKAYNALRTVIRKEKTSERDEYFDGVRASLSEINSAVEKKIGDE